jgi:hypothetical protein
MLSSSAVSNEALGTSTELEPVEIDAVDPEMLEIEEEPVP